MNEDPPQSHLLSFNDLREDGVSLLLGQMYIIEIDLFSLDKCLGQNFRADCLYLIVITHVVKDKLLQLGKSVFREFFKKDFNVSVLVVLAANTKRKI